MVRKIKGVINEAGNASIRAYPITNGVRISMAVDKVSHIDLSLPETRYLISCLDALEREARNAR